ncbi:DUF1152 domain-containing protein [Amycolatopsis anabasis]|uniref:DUF1152 domain-containing protein n=1 Tax=Amycolatopsis anabasis TaxID=1840409 RepID=UPI00131E85C1|nr:DUF1152 domain-containing protein [Amycolatopsis anabasis]
MPSALAIAAGGGGDAIAAAVLAARIAAPPVVLSYSWDRLVVDPLPGPRGRDEFTGLRALAGDVHEVLPSTAVRPPGGSSLPGLAAGLPARFLLLDPVDGAIGMAARIAAAAEHFGAGELVLVDVGGDAVAGGHEPGLRSPLADFLALAACSLADRPARLLVTGLALDGELTEREALERLDLLGARELPPLTREDFQPFERVFTWHPSEASGMLAAAARGIRGAVEVRDAGNTVSLSELSARVYEVDVRRAVSASAARTLTGTGSLAEAEARIRELRGTSELDYERAKARSRPAARPATLAAVDKHAMEANRRGADYLSVRRLAELVGATDPPSLAGLRQLLTRARPNRYLPPLYHVR